MRLLIAGGGTGGHIYPALAVARSLRARAGTPDLGWLGGHRGLERSIVPAADIGLTRLWLRSLRSAGRDIHLVLDPLRLGLSIPQAFVLLLARRPAAIFTTGGYVAIPTLLAAAILRIPSVLWEGNVVPGRSVRFVAARATVVAVSHPETAAALGHPRTYLTGTPIRPVDGIDVDAARERFGGRAGERILLVFGGSQAVRRINDAVEGALPRLVEKVRVVHVTGDAGYGQAIAARERLPEALRDRYRPYPFLHDEMTAALAAADLAVGRAGASTLAEAAAFALPTAIIPYPHASGEMTAALAAADLAVGRAGASTLAEAAAFALPTAIIPYPHASGHQRRNAEAFAAAGAAVLIEDAELDADRLVDVASLLTDPGRHAVMSAAARDLARPAAAAAVGDLVLAVALGETLPTQAEIDAVARGHRA